jgi:hypothetical protein
MDVRRSPVAGLADQLRREPARGTRNESRFAVPRSPLAAVAPLGGFAPGATAAVPGPAFAFIGLLALVLGSWFLSPRFREATSAAPNGGGHAPRQGVRRCLDGPGRRRRRSPRADGRSRSRLRSRSWLIDSPGHAGRGRSNERGHGRETNRLTSRLTATRALTFRGCCRPSIQSHLGLWRAWLASPAPASRSAP